MKRLFAAFAGVAVIGGIWIYAHNAEPARRRSEVAAPQHQGSSVRPGQPELRRPERPLPNGPFHATRFQLETRARAGDAEAALRLADVIGHCLRYERMPMERAVTFIATAAAYAFKLAGRPVDSDLNVDALLDRTKYLNELCEGTENLAATASAADAHAWMLRAAQLGHAAAMAHYADHAFSEFETHADLLDNAEEVARRRDRARALLERAFDAGEPEALFGYTKAHAGNGVLEKDLPRALAYWSAYRHSTATSDALGRFGDAALREQLSASQTQEVDPMTARILDRFHRRGERQ